MNLFDMSIHYSLGRPAKLPISACFLGAFPGTTVGLLMLGQVVSSLEFFLASGFAAKFWSEVIQWCCALSASHSMQYGFVVFCLFAQGAAKTHSLLGIFAFFEINWKSGGY